MKVFPSLLVRQPNVSGGGTYGDVRKAVGFLRLTALLSEPQTQNESPLPATFNYEFRRGRAFTAAKSIMAIRMPRAM